MFKTRLGAECLVLAAFLCLGSNPCSAGSISLGTASNYGVLGLNDTNINNSNVTVNGNEGVSQGGTLTNMAPSTITGNVYEFQAGQYSGPGARGGSLIIDPALLTQNNTDAMNAALAAAALTPTQTFGSISNPTTITGNGDLNVITINGDITSSLTLSGMSSDEFILNVNGTITYGGSSALGLAGGVSADHVLYNIIGNRNITSHVGNVFNGTLLGIDSNFNLDGTFNGEIIGGGGSISLLSGAVVNRVLFSPAAVPEPSSIVTASIAVLLGLGYVGVRRLRRR